MKTNLCMTIVIALVSLIVQEGFAQSESFKKGKQAYMDGRNAEALRHLQIAVNEEKYFMKGKEIPIAYAYMAIIKNNFIGSSLEKGTLNAVTQNPGVLSSSVTDVKNAIKFSESKNLNSLVFEAKSSTMKNASNMGRLVTDALLKMDFESKSDEVMNLAGLLNYELQNFSDIDSNTWEVYDMLGFTHYILGEKELAILEYKRSRDAYNASDSKEVSELHLYNYIYSTSYQFEVSKNYAEATRVIDEGLKYIDLMAHHPDYDDISKIKRLSEIESKLSIVQNKIADVSSISSTKE